MELVRVHLSQLKPYPNNPRYNEEAVDYVKESIDQVGYISLIVVDERFEILAGETRWRALGRLGEDEIDVIRISGMSEAQKRKFRLLDNKTAELSSWDLNKLLSELKELDFGDFDFWSSELEKMGELLVEKAEKPKKKKKPVICPRCGKAINEMEDDWTPFVGDEC